MKMKAIKSQKKKLVQKKLAHSAYCSAIPGELDMAQGLAAVGSGKLALPGNGCDKSQLQLRLHVSAVDLTH